MSVPGPEECRNYFIAPAASGSPYYGWSGYGYSEYGYYGWPGGWCSWDPYRCGWRW